MHQGHPHPGAVRVVLGDEQDPAIQEIPVRVPALRIDAPLADELVKHLDLGFRSQLVGAGCDDHRVRATCDRLDDEVSGSGSAELQDNGSPQIEFEYHLGHEAVLKAVREPSSTAC